MSVCEELLEAWLNGLVDEGIAHTLTEPFFMVKKLRKQYPSHEEFELDIAGVRARRSELERAETYFGLRSDPASDWRAVRTSVVAALRRLNEALGASRGPIGE